MNNLTFTVPLTIAARLQAEKMSQNASHPQRRQQIYLNQLAIYAVERYLTCLGFSTCRENSDSADLAFQILSDTADLLVKNWGRIECRPVLAESKVCEIPPEVWEERGGYIAVQFNAECSEATLLGFLPKVRSERVFLERFQSLDLLLEALHRPIPQPESEKDYLEDFLENQTLTRLQDWASGILETGWKSLEDLLTPANPRVAFNFRDASGLKMRKRTPSWVENGKFIRLGRQEEQVALVVRFIEETPPELNISVEVLPRDAHHLPRDLRLTILDENDRAVMQADGSGSEGLEFQFSGEPGERFSVEVAIGEFKMSEQFII